MTFFAALIAAAIASPEARFATVPRSLFDGADCRMIAAAHTTPPGKTVRAALNAALERLLAEDERTILLGEDLHDPYGGAFKVTAGLSTRYPGPGDLHADQRGGADRLRRSVWRSPAGGRSSR